MPLETSLAIIDGVELKVESASHMLVQEWQGHENMASGLLPYAALTCLVLPCPDRHNTACVALMGRQPISLFRKITGQG